MNLEDKREDVGPYWDQTRRAQLQMIPQRYETWTQLASREVDGSSSAGL
jgi:hypothetical protein